jgi:hypothetical protein
VTQAETRGAAEGVIDRPQSTCSARSKIPFVSASDAAASDGDGYRLALKIYVFASLALFSPRLPLDMLHVMKATEWSG